MQYQVVHCIGIGGIHVSAVAKLLHERGASVSGSDEVENEIVKEMREAGFPISIGHAAEQIPTPCDVVIYSDAVQPNNPELLAAKKRGVQTFDTHRFLAKLFLDKDQIVVTGTHGKSTTTSLLGSVFANAGQDPTVVVGTKVPDFEYGNLRVGREDLLIVEGDEFKSHVRSYQPIIMVLNNIEWDHADVFPDIESLKEMFGFSFDQIKDSGTLIFNVDDPVSVDLVESKREALMQRGIRVIGVGLERGDITFSAPHIQNGKWCTRIRKGEDADVNVCLKIPGEMNTRNAAMAVAAALAWKDALNPESIATAFAEFPGCWRRFERVGEYEGAIVISDYAHHPTEIRETLKATKLLYADRRLVAVFEPHQHNRTRNLYAEFAASFDAADVLILSEIYNVPGREEPEDEDVTSRMLADDIRGRGTIEDVRYGRDLNETEHLIREIVAPGDVILVMGAGPIDSVARKLVV